MDKIDRFLAARWAPLAFFVFGFLGACAYTISPWMGDDMDYYGYALGRHIPHPAFPPDTGFHFLRWPVWGLIWLYQWTGDFGIASYAFPPRLVVGLSTALLFFLGRLLAGPRVGLWAAIIFFFHPLASDMFARPMPDILEGLLAMAGFSIVWLRLRAAEANSRSLWSFTPLAGLALGLLLFVSWCNRPSGLIWFIALVLLAPFRPSLMLPLIPWALATFAAAFTVQGLIYQDVFGNFWHSWDANNQARDKKGTEPVAFFLLPFRFLEPMIASGLKAIVFAVACVGMWRLAHSTRRSDHALIAFFVLMYLGISCGIQGFGGAWYEMSPLVRSGERFIGSLSMPMALLAAVGLPWLATQALQRWPRLAWFTPLRATLALILILALSVNRPRRDLTLLADMAAWMQPLQPGQTVRADDDFYEFAFLAAPRLAPRLTWDVIQRHDLPKKPNLLAPDAVPGATRLFINRRRAMVTVRKRVENEDEVDPARVSQDLLGLAGGWRVASLIYNEDDSGKLVDEIGGAQPPRLPEFFMFEPSGAPIAWRPVTELIRPWSWERRWSGAGTLSFDDNALRFKRTESGRLVFLTERMPVPDALRGQLIDVRMQIASHHAEPFRWMVAFWDGADQPLSSIGLRTFAAPNPFYDFNALHIPPSAASFRVLIAVEGKAKAFEVRDIRWATPAAAAAATPHPPSP